MSLAAGTRLGPYEILSPLGAGGMGEVFRARDTRLGRDVAVKVLPQHLSANAEVRARFEREAKTVSSLNHPNICTLFDVGREGETDYLVMELVEGGTLAQRLQQGALPAAEVLRIGVQVADALDRAHRAGVIHRDLKPGNIMLTKSGAKLMDFGLARATGMAGSVSGSGTTMAALTQSPTVAQPLTAEGTIIGTFQYMAPEQLEGREADARSDLWALGCVLFEMATGRRAFDGPSQASLIAAIMHVQPQPLSQAAPALPPALDRLVSACLAKDPADRVQSAHDMKLQLAWMAEGVDSNFASAAPALPLARRRRWLVPALLALALVVVAVVVTTMLARQQASGADAPQRFVLGSSDLTPSCTPMVSPDGASVVFSVREDGKTRIVRRMLSTFEVQPIAGTEDGYAPFFSADGRWMGFLTTTAIRKVPIEGGTAQTIVNTPRVDAADWGRDDWVYFTPRSGGTDGRTALARVSALGGPIEVVAQLDTASNEREAWLPEILPDGKTVLVSIQSSSATPWRIVAFRMGGFRQVVLETGWLPRYAGNGHLLYVDSESDAVLAAPFDAGKLKFTGPAMAVTERAATNHAYDVSEKGVLVYVPTTGAGAGEEVGWIDRRGVYTPLMETRADWMQPRVSPDGKRVLLRKSGTNCELWVYDMGRGQLSRVAPDSDNHDAVWSPDGRSIAYLQSSAPVRMLSLSVEGPREVRTLAEGLDSGSPESWSVGGDLLAYTVTGRTTGSDIWVRSMREGAAKPFLATQFRETSPAVSPDGRWIAYSSDEAGPPQIFIRPHPDTGVSWQVSSDGGVGPLWSRDGRELHFVSGTKMMTARIETEPAIRVGIPTVLFDGGFGVNRARDYDVAPDGRFVVLRRSGEASQMRELRVVLHWRAALKEQVGRSH